ncbi:hypothetical protein HPP92_023306 [Vanilla planifolia]|uniref:Uncharacterized protein n=1 Tax=Vanilla planifolia TaxID=51239 RepID=A0A835PR85_VANPL|nr:hypothetical protein HPP92_023306 [Vanilla planifolia]
MSLHRSVLYVIVQMLAASLGCVLRRSLTGEASMERNYLKMMKDQVKSKMEVKYQRF